MLCERLTLDVSPAELERELVAAYRERTAAGVAPLPGAREFVRLASRRYRCFVVSGSSRRDIEHALRSLNVRDGIERYYGAEDYPRSKPAPDGYRKALEEAALAPEDVVVFEDSEAGIRSAEAAGLRLVVVTGAAAVPPPNAGAHPAVADFLGLGIEWLGTRFHRAGA
jgi:HAD superfamily hydrolase (TIGR01509 family)